MLLFFFFPLYARLLSVPPFVRLSILSFGPNAIINSLPSCFSLLHPPSLPIRPAPHPMFSFFLLCFSYTLLSSRHPDLQTPIRVCVPMETNQISACSSTFHSHSVQNRRSSHCRLLKTGIVSESNTKSLTELFCTLERCEATSARPYQSFTSIAMAMALYKFEIRVQTIDLCTP